MDICWDGGRDIHLRSQTVASTHPTHPTHPPIARPSSQSTSNPSPWQLCIHRDAKRWLAEILEGPFLLCGGHVTRGAVDHGTTYGAPVKVACCGFPVNHPATSLDRNESQRPAKLVWSPVNIGDPTSQWSRIHGLWGQLASYRKWWNLSQKLMMKGPSYWFIPTQLARLNAQRTCPVWK